MGVGSPFGHVQVPQLLDLGDACGSVLAIECGVDSREGLCPENFLMLQRSIRLPELRMPLRRKLSDAQIAWQPGSTPPIWRTVQSCFLPRRPVLSRVLLGRRD